MSNEETKIIQPKNEAKKSVETTKTEAPKETKKDNTTAKVAATAAAGVFGGAAGGAASVAAATILNADEQEEVVEEVQAEESVAAVKPESAAEVKEEEIAITPEETQEPDYTGNEGADPVVEPQPQPEPEPEPTPTSNEEPEQEVQILGVYERTTEEGVHQEMAVITNGEEVAAVLDVTGDGEADIIAIDENRNGEFEEGEVHDISEQHVGMEQFEQQYLAQQEMEAEQQETFSYTAQEESDYNNDAELIDA